MTINHLIQFIRTSEVLRRISTKMKAISWSVHCLKGQILKVGTRRNVLILFQQKTN